MNLARKYDLDYTVDAAFAEPQAQKNRAFLRIVHSRSVADMHSETASNDNPANDLVPGLAPGQDPRLVPIPGIRLANERWTLRLVNMGDTDPTISPQPTRNLSPEQGRLLRMSGYTQTTAYQRSALEL